MRKRRAWSVVPLVIAIVASPMSEVAIRADTQGGIVLGPNCNGSDYAALHGWSNDWLAWDQGIMGTVSQSYTGWASVCGGWEPETYDPQGYSFRVSDVYNNTLHYESGNTHPGSVSFYITQAGLQPSDLYVEFTLWGNCRWGCSTYNITLQGWGFNTP